ncbi:MAG: GNAT family N-acetyltransferase [Acetobacteraceae bacterium]
MSVPPLRPGRDEDAEGFIALIGACWSEYPGCILDVDGELPELRRLASHVADRGGALWAAEADRRIVGMIVATPMREDEAWEVSRLYVARDRRGSGLAAALLGAAESHARAAGAKRMVLWTDTRFEPAHRFYEKHSYVRSGSIRVLDDLSRSLEFRYAKPLAGTVVEALDAAAAVSAERRLAGITVACVEAGADLGFRAPLAPERARAHWRDRAAAVASGRAVLLCAWVEGLIAGALLLDLDQGETRRHRAELRDLMVHPATQRRGVGRALMARVGQAALAHGRRRIVLHAPAGGPLDRLLIAEGWTCAGTIPGWADEAGGHRPAEAVWWLAAP